MELVVDGIKKDLLIGLGIIYIIYFNIFIKWRKV